MTAPIFSEDVAGAETGLSDVDLEALGIEAQPTSVPPSRSYIRWKPIAEHARREVAFWRLATLWLGILWLLTMAALVVAVTVK